MIDHYDSFTYNLYDMLAQLTVEPPTVIAKDAFESWDDLPDHFDGILLSPGPGSPQEQPLLSKQAILKNPATPVLGVCLGHQLMALEYGATVGKAPIPIHGQDHWITQTCNETTAISPLWNGLPTSFRVVRYHSLAATDLPECLQVTATSKDDVIQGIQHNQYPHYGVQFHPESIGTQYGMALLENFCQIVQQHKDDRTQDGEMKASRNQDRQILLSGGINGHEIPTERVVNGYAARLHQPPSTEEEDTPEDQQAPKPRFQVLIHSLQMGKSAKIPTPLQVFDKCYSRQDYAMWLDSSSYPSRGNLDILAAPTSDKDLFEYHLGESPDILTRLEQELFGKGGEMKEIAAVENLSTPPTFFKDTSTTQFPFDYRGGILGFLGYEVRHDTIRFLQQQEQGPSPESKQTVETRSSTPNAAFFLARQSMVYHHPTNQWYLLGLVEQETDIMVNMEWMKETRDNMQELADTKQVETVAKTTESKNPTPLAFVPNRPKQVYEQNIADCHKLIEMGESYELCLTNQLEAKISHDSSSAWKMYQILRQRNPAPYSAYFRWNQSDLSICCSSPERFMSIARVKDDDGKVSLQAEAKPIKGTCARVLPENGSTRNFAEAREDDRRARSLELSLKNRAENLMIVDLLRNDMSRVCQVGSVHVAKLMDVESFATVHQMVSTIRGTLCSASKEDEPAAANCIDLLKASFPGGSMTGAPKIRTMELLEGLEGNVERGPYSGSLGYLSVNGCMDMNIIIRTAVVTSEKTSVGAGGAITALSETQDEYDEMLLKAHAVVKAVQEWAATSTTRSSSSTLPMQDIIETQ